MAKSKKAAPQLKVPAEPITEFEVTKGGTLRMADYVEAETRAEFYEDVAGRWEGSPQDLSDAMDECQPLAWAVNSIYSDFRDEIVADVGAAEPDAKQNKRRIAVLKERLKKLPEEPEEGASIWLLGLTTSEFEANVVPQIQEWFSEPPDWNFEDDYLPQTGTAQGAALEFFRRMDADSVDLLGVDIVEGEHPGSTYYAAELRGDIEAANTAAISCGLAVRFVRHGQAVERTRRTSSEVGAVGPSQASPDERQPIQSKFSGRSSASLPATVHSANGTPCQPEKRSSTGVRKQPDLRPCTSATNTVLSLASHQVGWQSATQHTGVSCASGHSRTRCHCLTSAPNPDSARSYCRTEDAVPTLRQMLAAGSEEQTPCT